MKIKFLGATRQVTGSSYLLEVGEVNILIDCGLFQERDYSSRNWGDFPISPDKIDFMLLTHVHLDHCGLVPKLVREGFKGSILLTPASKALFPIVILDSARMQEEDAAYKKKRHELEGRMSLHPEIPLYTVQDAENSLDLLKEVPYEKSVPLNDQVTVCFHDAGHILGSAIIEVIVQEEGESKNIIFSGDIGQWDKPILANPSVFDRADYVVMESTYGDRNHDTSEAVDEKLSRIVNETVSAGGKVLIPTFVIERAQDLLFHLSQLAREESIPPIPTFLDSPMIIEITKVFEQFKESMDEETLELFKEGHSPFDFPGLRLAESVEESKAISQFEGPAIILAGSGMITGGRIKHHLAREITHPESAVIFVGYQAVGTLGRQILEGVSPVRVFGQLYPVRMKIESIEGFSAHAGMDDLHRWLDNFKLPPKLVFLTHGEEESIQNLENYVNSKEGWHVTAPSYLDEYTL